MIKLIESITQDKLRHLPGVKDASLQFLKYSTPSGHGSLDGKVLFFVFGDKSPQPILVVKTIRVYASRYVVENAFHRLMRLHTLVAGRPYENMFPRPLHLYDDGKEYAFSIESHIVGTPLKNTGDIQSALRQYTEFQKSIYTRETFDSFFAYVRTLIGQLAFDEEEAGVLMEYAQTLSPIDFKIARLPQHSDLTLDNMLSENGELRVIDCDSFGLVELAGYDIYRLMKRHDARLVFSYLDRYFRELGIDTKASKVLIFLYYLHDLVYKKAYILKGKTAEDVVSDFEAQMQQHALRILHTTRMNYFSNKSHVYTTAKTAEAMHTTDGIAYALVSTDDSLLRKGATDAFFKNLGLRPFPVHSLPAWDAFTKDSSLRIMNWLETFFANIRMARYLFAERKHFDVLSFRDSTLFLPILMSKYLFHKPLFMESHAVLHTLVKRWITEFVAKRVDGIISISGGLKEYYDRINANGIVSFCSASDPEQFAGIVSDQSELRATYGVPKDKIILGYVGNLSFTGNYDSYGFEDVIRALPLLRTDIVLVGVGEKDAGETAHLKKLAQELGVSERVVFLPKVPKSEVAAYLRSFDVLIHPKAGAQIGNSPAKLFEWLLAGRPIIAARTRAIAEILKDGENALLVEYEDPSSWKQAVERVLSDTAFSNRLVQGATLSAKKYTWEGRGRAISDFIRSTLSKNA